MCDSHNLSVVDECMEECKCTRGGIVARGSRTQSAVDMAGMVVYLPDTLLLLEGLPLYSSV